MGERVAVRVVSAIILYGVTLLLVDWGAAGTQGIHADPDIPRALAACGFFGLVSVILAPWLGAFTGPLMRGGYVDSPTPEILFVLFGYLLLGISFVSALYAS